MNFTLEATRQLAAEAQVMRQRATRPLVNARVACRELSEALESLRKKRAVVEVNRPKLDVERVWAEFAASDYDLNALDGLRFRALCSAEETALRPEFVAALSRNPDKLKRTACLYGIVINYFSEWRAMKEPARLERLLTSVFASYSAQNPAVQKWRSANRLFSEDAATFLAEEICSDQKKVDEVLSSFYIGPNTSLGKSTRARAARSACDYLLSMEGRDGTRSGRLSYLHWMIESILHNLTDDTFSHAISSLILSESAKRPGSFQKALRRYVQSHKNLGDPRLRSSSLNWRLIAPDARQRYLSWLARESITFFFDTIISSENSRRKDFWLVYQDRIRDFQVAVSDEDLHKVKANQNPLESMSYSRVAHPTTSAFMMEFQGYGTHFIVVEFSEKGNAAHIFRLSDFEAQGVSLRSPRFDFTHLKQSDKSQRILHIGNWEQGARNRLAAEFGITP